MPNKPTVVRTNSTPGSVKVVELKVLTFGDLWDNYPIGNPYDNPAYNDQCAIRMSVTFHRVGIEMKSFSEKLIKPLSGQKSIGRIILDGKATATRGRSPDYPRQRILLALTGNQRSRAERGSSSFRVTGRGTAKVRRTQAADILTYGTARG
jgi:hypothetical protein